MNFTPFAGQFAGSIPAAAMHQFTTAKFAQNITAATNGSQQMGQVVGVLSGGEGGVHYLRPVEGGSGFQALPQPAQQQLITLPITMPGAKPGDPQQTVQIQVMSPAVTNLPTQPTIQQPKYQMAHMQIPIQTFQQGTTVLTVAYAQQDGSEGMQIIGNSGLPEGIQVVAALQPQDVQQMLAAQMVNSENKIQGPEGSVPQGIQIGALLPGQQIINLSDDGKKATINNNNNNVTNTFRIKQENNEEQLMTVESGGQQWTVAAQGSEIAEYISRLQGNQLPVSLHQFLRFNDSSSLKREALANSGTLDVNTDSKDEDNEEIQEEFVSNQESEAPLKAKKKKKYKKKPPKPKKPKPGQVVIATSQDGTTLFCCPECHMAYPEKETLEQHLVGHKIERRYICGICGAGLKRREHLERHKLGHNPDRPFVCSVCLKGFKRKEHLNLHLVIHSGDKTEICQECGKGFYRKDHLRKHARSHATRRAREELAATQGSSSNVQMRHQATQNSIPVITNQSTIQPEITIHVPTSTMAVPVQISVPHHIVTMANNSNGQQTITIKPEMEDMLLQQMVRNSSSILE